MFMFDTQINSVNTWRSGACGPCMRIGNAYLKLLEYFVVTRYLFVTEAHNVIRTNITFRYNYVSMFFFVTIFNLFRVANASLYPLVS